MRLDRIVFWYDEVSSTMDIAHRLAKKDFPEGTMVIARKQFAGRGRYNRMWSSPLGGLWFSIILRPRSTYSLNLIPLAFAIATHETLSTYSSDFWIKWPNDVYFEEKKIAGILSEASFIGNRLSYVVVGVGINLNNNIPQTLRPTATSLKEIFGKEVDLASFLRRLIRNITHYYSHYVESPNLIIDEFNARTIMIRRPITVLYAGKVINGIGIGVNSRGEFMIKTGNSVLAINHYDAFIKVNIEGLRDDE